MLQKMWNKCKKCGCDKAEDSEKLCESCKEKRREFWSDIKKNRAKKNVANFGAISRKLLALAVPPF